MIYLWKIPHDFKNRDVGEYDKDTSPDDYWLTKGNHLNEFSPIPSVHFIVPCKNILKFDCIPNSTLVPLVNDKIKNILENIAPNDVQFFPAKLICKDREIEGYYFLNITHLIKGIDQKNSICLTMDNFDGTNFITGFHSLTYLKGCMNQHLLARDQDYPESLLVSEKIKQIFDKEKITGVRLVRPEDYYHGPVTAADLINEARALENEEKEDDN